MKQVYQYRYFGKDNSKNNLDSFTVNDLISGNIFADKAIYQLGIQSFPGAEFYLNNGTYPIILGASGIYELTPTTLTSIESIKFSPNTIKIIEGSPSAYLLIDIVYEGSE